MLTVNETEFLEDYALFWGLLTAQEQALINENTSCKKYGKGQNLFSNGKECLGLVIVKSGKLRIYTVSEDGREVTFCRLDAGGVCMLTAGCAVNSTSVDVVVDVEETSEIFIIPSEFVSRLVAQNPRLESFLLRSAISKLTEIIWGLQQILFMSMDKRLAGFLLDESTRLNSSEIKLTHEQIAKYVGSAREVVSRMLKYFEQEGLVKLQRGSIQIIDRQRLIEI